MLQASTLVMGVVLAAAWQPAAAQSECLLDDGTTGGADAGTGTDSFACGPDARVTPAGGSGAPAVQSTAIGNSAEALGDHSTAVGQYAYAAEDGSAFGAGSEAIGYRSVALGTGDDDFINNLSNPYGARDDDATALAAVQSPRFTARRSALPAWRKIPALSRSARAPMPEAPDPSRSAAGPT